MQENYVVRDTQGNLIFHLGNPNETAYDTISTRDVYNQGEQWFSPSAENHIPIHDVHSNIQNLPTVNHVDPNNFYSFANETRPIWEYRTGGSGDWKGVPVHGNRSLLSEVNGNPIWSDALGQIPSAVDMYRKYLRSNRRFT